MLSIFCRLLSPIKIIFGYKISLIFPAIKVVGTPINILLNFNLFIRNILAVLPNLHTQLSNTLLLLIKYS